MNIFFSSDHHFHHANIIKHCGRPFPDIRTMNLELMRLWNETVAPDDLVYYLGDFSWSNISMTKETRRHLNGEIVLIRGNHDRGPVAMASAGFVGICKSTILDTSMGRILLVHKPPETLEEFQGCDACFGGHVHEKWVQQTRFSKKILNVGVDVRSFRPVLLEELLVVLLEP
jgi:calcineurin-like phosphoesterase family protein